MLPVEQAIETFVRGFAFTRSFTHPYEVTRAGRLWLMKDAPRRSGDYRTEEFVAHGVAPDEVVATIRSQHPGRFALCVILALGEPSEPMKDSFKSRGFRLSHREPFMVRALEAVEPLDGPLPVRRVLDPKDADLVATAAGSRQILPQHLEEQAPIRLYAALEGERPVGWVRSITLGDDRAWVSNMYVQPEYRRRGIGRALMSAMLADDKAHGIQHSVLLASNAGSMLYSTLGYEQIGTLHLFTPAKGRWTQGPTNAA